MPLLLEPKFSTISITYQYSNGSQQTLNFTDAHNIFHDILAETIFASPLPDRAVRMSYRFEKESPTAKEGWIVNRISELANVFYACSDDSSNTTIPRQNLQDLTLEGVELNAQDRAQFIKNLQAMTGLTKLTLAIDAGKISTPPKTLKHLIERCKNLVETCKHAIFHTPTFSTLSPEKYLQALLSLPLEELALKDLDSQQVESVCKSLTHLNPRCTHLSLKGAALSKKSSHYLVKYLSASPVTHLNLSQLRCTDTEYLPLFRQLAAHISHPIQIDIGNRYIGRTFFLPEFLAIAKGSHLRVKMDQSTPHTTTPTARNAIATPLGTTHYEPLFAAQLNPPSHTGTPASLVEKPRQRMAYV